MRLANFILIRRCTQYFPQMGLGLSNNNLQLNVQGGLGQNSTSGSTITIIGGP